MFTLFSGGCGGSSSSSSSSSSKNNNISKGDINASILGNLDAVRLNNSDLAPYIAKVLSIDNFADIDALSDLKVLFIDDVSNLKSGAGSNTGDYPELADIKSGYDNGLVIAALYPDSEDINVLCEVLDIKDPPLLSADKGYLELLAVAKREVNSFDEQFAYTIIDLDDVHELSYDENAVITTSLDTGFTGEPEVESSGDNNIIPEEFSAENFNKSRLNDFLEWIVRLNNTPETLFNTSNHNNNLNNNNLSLESAAATAQLTDYSSSEGPDEINVDSAGERIKFPIVEGIMEETPLYNKSVHSDWTTNRKTRLKYDTYSIHVFNRKDDGQPRDYFLIRANNVTNTANQFVSVINSKAYSKLWRSKARLIFGFTRRLVFNHYIDEDTGDGSVILAASIPEAKDTAQTKSSSMSYSFGAAVAMSSKPPSDRKKSDTREGEAAPSFNVGIGYTDTVSNTAIDYKILRGTRTDSNKRANVSYEFEFAWPKLGREIGDWDDDTRLCYQELEAWPSSKEHTSKLEWIWEVKPDIWKRAKNNMLTVWVYAEWTDGLSQGPYFRRIGSYWGDRLDREVNKKGVWRKFTLYKPMYMAVTPVSFAPAAGTNAFNKNAGSASFALLSEYKWVIKSKPDWLSDFTMTSGEPTVGTARVVTFKYSANNTGKPRTGEIVIGSSENNNDTRNVTIKVTQGAN